MEYPCVWRWFDYIVTTRLDDLFSIRRSILWRWRSTSLTSLQTYWLLTIQGFSIHQKTFILCRNHDFFFFLFSKYMHSSVSLSLSSVRRMKFKYHHKHVLWCYKRKLEIQPCRHAGGKGGHHHANQIIIIFVTIVLSHLLTLLVHLQPEFLLTKQYS